MGDEKLKGAGFYTDTASQLMQYYNSTNKQSDTSNKINVLSEVQAYIQLGLDALHKQYFEENPVLLKDESIKRR